MQLVRWFDEITMDDLPEVGGKNASLGEMISNLSAAGHPVPGGFATTVDGFRSTSPATGSTTASPPARASRRRRRRRAVVAGREIRGWIDATPLPPTSPLRARDGYASPRPRRRPDDRRGGALVGDRRGPARRVVRRPAGDVPQRRAAATTCSTRPCAVFASLYNDRAIAYRVHKGFAHDDVALSVGVQRMVRSDLGVGRRAVHASTPSPVSRCVFITSSYGLGELLVQGAVNPDEFYVSKSALRSGQARRSCSGDLGAKQRAHGLRRRRGTGRHRGRADRRCAGASRSTTTT